jgi:DNA-binding GntR family transcriptional regulator
VKPEINIVSLKENLVQYLRTHIITGDLPPGHKLNEIELSSALGVSRVPLREAFRLLENEKLIISIPRKGCIVAPISLKNFNELYLTREMIELFAVDILSSKPNEDLTKVAEAIKKAKKATKRNDSDPYQRYQYLLDRSAFHIRLVEAAENDLLTHFYKAILPNLARYQILFRYQSSSDEHQRILELIKGKKYQQAKSELRFHIHKLHGRLQKILQTKLDF